MKYDVLLCDKIFLDCYLMPKPGYQISEKEMRMNQIIRNHRLVLSDNLLRIYKNYAIKNGNENAYDFFQQWYATEAIKVASKDVFIHVFDEASETEDIDDVFSALSTNKRVGHPIVVCGFYCANYLTLINTIKPTKVIISSNILDESIDNQLRRNTIPFGITTSKDDPVLPYVKWFEEMLMDQKQITIFNRYAYKTTEFKSMTDYILERIASGSVVRIYTTLSEEGIPTADIIERNKVIKEIADKKRCFFLIYDYNANNGINRLSYHDRRIFLENSYISFTAGFCSLPVLRKSEVLTEGNLEISHKQCDAKAVVDSILEEHPGYYEVWNSNKVPEDVILGT